MTSQQKPRFAAVAIAAMIAAFGGAAVYAATSAGSHTGPWMHGSGPNGWDRPAQVMISR